jgi:hypothetical protein
MAITGVGQAGYTPAPLKQTLITNYIDFTANGNGWAQQYLPDLMEAEAEVFGNRTISGFLAQVGAEEAMSADQVIWSEQGRLHLSYKDVLVGGTGNAGTLTFDAGALDADGKSVTSTTTAIAHGIRKGDMLLISQSGVTKRAYVTGVAASGSGTANGIVTFERYDGENYDEGTMADGHAAVLVFGSEYAKGVTGREGANKPQFLQRNNKPIILKDKYEVSGSDASQIGWVEVSGEDGQNGYMWYLKAAGDTKSRFADYLEMAMLEAVDNSSNDTAGHGGGTITGTEGLFDALETRGNVANTMTAMEDYDELIHELDANGAIEENMMFMDRTTSLKLDDILAAQNSHGSGGTSYGVFSNSEDMALNLGFTGFRRGSYDFYKSDFKYLNDASTRGLINSTDATNAIRGILIPAGVSTVYDQGLGRNIKRPFLHVRYRASQMEDRKMKTWTTGSVGAATSDLDAMEMHMLSERCLVTQGANNFVLFKGAA